MQLALQAIGVSTGDEVLVQSLTYVATFQAITACGAKPIACDVCKETLCIDLNDAKRKISSKTKAIIPVHYAGGFGEIKAIHKFSKENNIRVVEDAAHAFGTKTGKQIIGSFGDIACFSFDGIKNITSGEGGCVVSNDEQVLQKIRDARLLGVENDTEKRFSGQRSWDFDVHQQGWRYHMSNVMAAIGLAQLKSFDKMADTRKSLAKKYVGNLLDNSDFSCLKLNYDEVVPHIFVVKNLSTIPRSVIIEHLAKKKIQLGIHYFPNHRLSYFKNPEIAVLDNTDQIFDSLITLPMHPDLTVQDVDYVCENLISATK